MNFIEIIELIFTNSNQIKFGGVDAWENNIFKAKWFSDQNKQRPNASGLYWFLTDADIVNIERPSLLPNNGCDFSYTARNNSKIFTTNLLPISNNDGLKVVYNGHESNVMNRVRQHFSLSQLNHRTGALGINHYNLSNKNWVLVYFTVLDTSKLNLDKDVELKINNLLNSKSGRTALENAWRIKNGWPLLCKE